MCDTERTQPETPISDHPAFPEPDSPPVFPPDCPPACPDPYKHLEYKPVCLMAILYCSLGASAILVALAAILAAMSAFRR
jgi:hypothetical protein